MTDFVIPESTPDGKITPEILKGVVQLAYKGEEPNQDFNEAAEESAILEIWAGRAIIKLNQLAAFARQNEGVRQHLLGKISEGVLSRDYFNGDRLAARDELLKWRDAVATYEKGEIQD